MGMFTAVSMGSAADAACNLDGAPTSEQVTTVRQDNATLTCENATTGQSFDGRNVSGFTADIRPGAQLAGPAAADRKTPALSFGDAGRLTIGAGGSVTSDDPEFLDGTVLVIGSGARIDNDGSILSNGGNALEAARSGSVSTGLVLNNDGLIYATIDGNRHSAASVGRNATVTNTGSIIAEYTGTTRNSFAGLTLKPGGTVDNEGIINVALKHAASQANGIALDIAGSSKITNSGSILARNVGVGSAVRAGNGELMLTNDAGGRIDATGSGAAVVSQGDNTAIVNAGTIIGGTRAIGVVGDNFRYEHREGATLRGDVRVYKATPSQFVTFANSSEVVYVTGKSVVVDPAVTTFTGVNQFTLSGTGSLTLSQDFEAETPSTQIGRKPQGNFKKTLTFDVQDAGGEITSSGVISDAQGGDKGSLRKTGPGRLRLTGDNTYTGGTTINRGGSLIVGDGATSGSITGDVVDNGILNFARSDAVRFDGVISGSGSVAHAGTGRLTLTGDSTYTGPTFVSNGGTLMLQGSLTSDIDVRSSSRGTGSRLAGTGTTTGTVTVESGASIAPGRNGIGTLSVGNLNLREGGVMEIDGLAEAGTGLASDFISVSGTATFGATRAGAGAPYGKTVMDVTFNANTTLPAFSDIIVVAADKGVLGRAPAVILDPASLPNGQNFYLNLDASNSVDNPGGGVGPGELIKPGKGNAGFIVLQVVKSDPVPKKPHQLTVINAPYLVPNARPVLTPSQVPQLVPPQSPTAVPHLVPGLIKGPTANVTTPVVAHKGGKKPATGIKVVNHGVQVGGTLTPQPQTTTGTQVGPHTIPVGTGNTVVVVEPPTDLGTTEFISITGTYGKVSQKHAQTGTTYRLLYGPHKVDVYKTPTNYGNLGPLGVKQTATQKGVGNALTGLLPEPHQRPGTTAVGQLVDTLYPLGTGSINGFLDSVAGTDEDPTFVAVMNNRLFQDAVSARLSDRRDQIVAEQGGVAGGENRAGWATVMGRVAETDDYLGGADLRSSGLALGADMDFTPEIAVGAGLAYTTTSIDKDSGADDRVRNLDFGAYASWARDDWFANGLVGFGRHWLDLDRRVAVGTGAGTTLSGKAQARSFFASIEGGRSFRTGSATIEPMAGLRYMYLDRDGYTESGPDTLARDVSDTQLNAWQGIVGVRAYRDYKAANGTVWRPEVKVGYARDFGDTDIDETATLIGAPGSAFPVLTAGPGDDVGFVQLRLTGKRGGADYFVDYKADIREDFVNQSIGAGVNIAF